MPAVSNLDIQSGIYTATLLAGETQRRITFLISTSLGDTVIHSAKSIYVNPDTVSPATDITTFNRWCQVVNPNCDLWGTIDSGDPYDANDVNEFKTYISSDHLALVHLFVDPFMIGRKMIPAVPFGIALLSSLESNILGLGFTESEAAPHKYPNLPQVMKDNELTKINAYSIWLNAKSARDGEIIFGGYNQAKHTGNFAHLQVLKVNGGFTESIVPVKSASFGKAGKTLSTASLNTAILDLGAQLSWLPREFAEALGKAVGATLDDDNYIIDCELSDEVARIYMVVDFGSVKIKLTAEDLVLPNTVSGTPTGKCFWGVSWTNNRPILGNNFLRRAYIVFDHDHKIISIAQTAYTHKSKAYEIPEDGLQALGDLVGTGDPDPELEKIAGNAESGDWVAENPDTMLGNTNNEASTDASALSDPVGYTREGTINPVCLAAATESMSVGNMQGTQEPTNFDESTAQTPYSLPLASNALGTVGAGNQQDKSLATTPNTEASFNSEEPGQFTAKLPSLFAGTEQPAANGITDQGGETAANSPTQDAFIVTPSNNEPTRRYNSASNLISNPGSGESPIGNSNQALFPAGTNSQGLGMNLASALFPGRAGGENMFLDTNTA